MREIRIIKALQQRAPNGRITVQIPIYQIPFVEVQPNQGLGVISAGGLWGTAPGVSALLIVWPERAASFVPK